MDPIQVRQNDRRPLISVSALTLLAMLACLALAPTAGAATSVPLGTAGTYAVLSGTPDVKNTGPTVLNGDLGVSPAASVIGFPPGVVNGNIHPADAPAAQAQSDLTAAYLNAAGQPGITTLPQLGGTTKTPGVYNSASGFDITGVLTLDGQGDPNSVFIFQAGSTLVTAAGPGASQVRLINGAQSCNVFWQVGSSATIKTSSDFSGTVLALTSIAAQTNATINGRLLARNGETTLDTNTVTRPTCAPAAADTTPPTVTITNVPKACTETNFKLRVRVSDASGIRHTDVFLDGKRVKRSSKKSFSVPLPAKSLSPGVHKIRVVATDKAGNTRTRKARFQRCESRAAHFTG